MPEPTHHVRVLIIGAGPAGYTAAIYAARASLKPMLVAGLQPGGQLTITTDVENYPGFADVIQGPWLMEQMEAQAEHVGTRLVDDLITRGRLHRAAVPLPSATPATAISADAVIIATGAQARWLGLPSPRRACTGAAFRPAPPATASSSAASKSRWSAAATPRSRRRCTSPTTPTRSP